jgi:hypothetical protein
MMRALATVRDGGKCTAVCGCVNFELMEATPGIEPGFADLQSAASPLRHVASRLIPAEEHCSRWSMGRAENRSGPIKGRIWREGAIYHRDVDGYKRCWSRGPSVKETIR